MNNKALSVQELLSGCKYVIPDYQRNYAWEMRHVEQLIQDVADYASDAGHGTPYYVGNIIVEASSDASEVLFETIDGQQRLTTIFIILCALKKKGLLKENESIIKKEVLTFSYRDNSENALKLISGQTLEPPLEEKCEEHILEVYNALCNKEIIETKCNARKLEIEDFVAYLLSDVKFLRIPLPSGIDKNHYFEVMNSRGVQLEQHEIIKSELMGYLQGEGEKAQKLFDILWNACSFMERYVQMNITDVSLRTIIFGNNWVEPPIRGNKSLSDLFDSISAQYNCDVQRCNNRTRSHKMIDFLMDFKEGKYSSYIDDKTDDDGESFVAEERFYSVIDFPNFLLHVLKLSFPSSRLYPKLVLDDKSLEKSFSCVLEKIDKDKKKDFAKQFIVNLLQCRFLFDKYSLRRDRAAKITAVSKEIPSELSQGDDERKWCVKQLKQTPSDASKVEYVATFDEKFNEEIKMLLCVFHVSLPSRIRKNWLQAVLAYAYKEVDLSGERYLAFLKELAKSYMRDSYLADNGKDIINLIYSENGELICRPQNTNSPKYNNLYGGVSIERFIFNYFEYILWRERGCKPYEFSYRTSVEHFYPQNPESISKIDTVPLNSFGNLAILSSKINSKFSNLPPKGKYDSYSGYFVDNLKLTSMKEKMEAENECWEVKQINEYQKYAEDLFSKYLFEGEDV